MRGKGAAHHHSIRHVRGEAWHVLAQEGEIYVDAASCQVVPRAVIRVAAQEFQHSLFRLLHVGGARDSGVTCY